MFGMGAPMRLMMERKIVSTVSKANPNSWHSWLIFCPLENLHMPALPRSNIHLDILMGRDEMLDVHDVFLGAQLIYALCVEELLTGCTGREEAPPLDIHAEMERKLRM